MISAFDKVLKQWPHSKLHLEQVLKDALQDPSDLTDQQKRDRDICRVAIRQYSGGKELLKIHLVKE